MRLVENGEPGMGAKEAEGRDAARGTVRVSRTPAIPGEQRFC